MKEGMYKLPTMYNQFILFYTQEKEGVSFCIEGPNTHEVYYWNIDDYRPSNKDVVLGPVCLARW